MTDARILTGDARVALADLPAESVQMCVTSPPYMGLRDYQHPQQIGLESTLREYVDALVDIFELVRRVLRSDGTLWLNLGDSYAGSRGAQSREHAGKHAPNVSALSANQVKAAINRAHTGSLSRTPGLKPKDLMGIPWRVAFSLQDAGWWLRRDIIWEKPNPLPESVTDRPTTAHEYVFLLSKSRRYHFDAAAIAEPLRRGSRDPLSDGYGRVTPPGTSKRSGNKIRRPRPGPAGDSRHQHGSVPWEGVTRNARSVWTFPTARFDEAHFATFPPELPRRCILAGSRPGDLVLDPFSGAATTGVVALELGRRYLGVELNPAYVAMSERRLAGVTLGLPLEAA